MDHVKIIFEYDEGTEGLWATPVAEGFVVDNFPIYLKGVCFGDVVEATLLEPGVYQYLKTVSKSGNSVYRLFYREEKAGRASQLLSLIKDLGCSYEGTELGGAKLLAVNIPAATDADSVWNIMKTGLDEGTWDIQEGDDRHPCANDDQPCTAPT